MKSNKEIRNKLNSIAKRVTGKQVSITHAELKGHVTHYAVLIEQKNTLLSVTRIGTNFKLNLHKAMLNAIYRLERYERENK